MDALTLDAQPQCCPQYVDLGRRGAARANYTAAYPNAIACLQRAGCAGTALAAGLQGECRAQGCGAAPHDACAMEAAASRTTLPLWTLALVMMSAIAFLG
eukprot:TRINITY_DN17323_c0_g1_i2.p3 TRINITY_DN17323_c0_g1~~TRINITY_DN17323_c0_g1_i2.p3  ORF type:complete len:100 (-),score=39.37 TRINITY_DN17323_c0_g1_i2:49-348(-)